MEMTDWTTQMQSGVEQWLKAQREWWEALLRGAGSGSGGGAEDLQRRTIEAWRQAAQGVVDAQADVLRAAVREQPRGDAGALLQRWTDAQREMWQGWLAVLNQSGGAGGATGMTGAGGITDAGRGMVDSLRHAAEQLVQSQADWTKAWSAAGGQDDDAEVRGGP
jgi:hypothetical protein